MAKIDVYLEVGQKRVFAGALDWPGWCRSGQDEESALQALLEYGGRYARIVRSVRLGFQTPLNTSAFVIKEHLEGNATTDFGAPGLAPSADAAPVSAAELRRFQKILKACWQALDHAAEMAAGKTLRSGPRGGGRELDALYKHVLEAEAGYLRQLGGRLPNEQVGQADPTRQAIVETVTASARGEIPSHGPRGGRRWTPRYFVRRAAWHALDHVWEIEDRVVSK